MEAEPPYWNLVQCYSYFRWPKELPQDDRRLVVAADFTGNIAQVGSARYQLMLPEGRLYFGHSMNGSEADDFLSKDMVLIMEREDEVLLIWWMKDGKSIRQAVSKKLGRLIEQIHDHYTMPWLGWKRTFEWTDVIGFDGSKHLLPSKIVHHYNPDNLGNFTDEMKNPEAPTGKCETYIYSNYIINDPGLLNKPAELEQDFTKETGFRVMRIPSQAMRLVNGIDEAKYPQLQQARGDEVDQDATEPLAVVLWMESVRDRVMTTLGETWTPVSTFPHEMNECFDYRAYITPPFGLPSEKVLPFFGPSTDGKISNDVYPDPWTAAEAGL